MEVWSLSFSQASPSLLACGSQVGSATVWDTAKGARICTLPLPQWAGCIRAVALSEDGRRVLVGCLRNTVFEYAVS